MVSTSCRSRVAWVVAFVIVLAVALSAATIAVAAEPYAGTTNISPHVPSNEIVTGTFAPFTDYAGTTNISPHVPSNLIVP